MLQSFAKLGALGEEKYLRGEELPEISKNLFIIFFLIRLWYNIQYTSHQIYFYAQTIPERHHSGAI